MVLVSMPWSSLARPSLALGILGSVLGKRGVPSATRSFHLAFGEHLVTHTANDERPLTLDDYTTVADRTPEDGYGDWIFAVEPYRTPRPEADPAYFAAARATEDHVRILQRMRELVPAFLEACVTDVLAAGPAVVGFTTTFGQNVSSLVMAKLLKQRAPELTIVFGGANCEGPMGAALHRAFPWIDCVVRGEGELVFAELVDDLLGGRPVREQPGLCFRRDGEPVHCAEAASAVRMDEIPLPDFDEFFDRVDRSPVEAAVRTRLRMPYESARGCWWGAKHHCTFCGLNGASMAFRSKSPARVVDDIRTLAERYQVLDFFVVDNIIDMKYFGSVLPELARTGWDLRLFFETKANLRLDQVRELYVAGVTQIQPGIESLSTPILKLMRKGVTALQNIRLLKWCAAHRIEVSWNILYGFPGEPPEEYAKMAPLLPLLAHLSPPNASRLRIDRFSPYFVTPTELGIQLTGPRRHYQHLYDVDATTLFDLAYHFRAEYLDGRDPSTYAAPVVEAIERWRDHGMATYRSLRYRRGPGFIVVDDRRPGLAAQRYEFDAAEAEIYLACDAGESPAGIRERLAEQLDADLGEADVRAFLDELVACGLMFREGDRYLALAIAEHPDELFRLEAAAEERRRRRPALVVVS